MSLRNNRIHLIYLLLTGLLLGYGAGKANAQDNSNPAQHDESNRRDRTENTLIIWAGDKAHVKPDFIAVIDFDERSPRYGKVLRTVPLTGPSAIGNEPHHVGLSADGKTFVGAGLLSVLRGQDQVFFFDVSHPRDPQFTHSDNPPHTSIADEFDSLSNGGFFGTFMGTQTEPIRAASLNMTPISVTCRRGRSTHHPMDSIPTAWRSTKRTI
jgi:hypothetical protein